MFVGVFGGGVLVGVFGGELGGGVMVGVLGGGVNVGVGLSFITSSFGAAKSCS